MQKNDRIKQIVRFRRWSRKGYAMFFSVGRQVTIGCLAKGIIEVALRKQKGKTIFSLYAEQGKVNLYSEREEEVFDGVLLTVVVLPEITSESVCAAKDKGKLEYNNVHKRHTNKVELSLVCVPFLFAH